MGFIYAMSNKSMPGILKIGMTERSVEERLKEANSPSFIPIPFIIEIFKQVKNCKEKEKLIHQILHSKRVNPKRDFFQVSLEEIVPIFELIEPLNNEDQNDKIKEMEIQIKSLQEETYNIHDYYADTNFDKQIKEEYDTMYDFVYNIIIPSKNNIKISLVKDEFKEYFQSKCGGRNPPYKKLINVMTTKYKINNYTFQNISILEIEDW